MKVKNEVDIIDLNGKQLSYGEDKALVVENVINNNELVSLEFEGTKIVVNADELKRAVENSSK